MRKKLEKVPGEEVAVDMIRRVRFVIRDIIAEQEAENGVTVISLRAAILTVAAGCAAGVILAAIGEVPRKERGALRARIAAVLSKEAIKMAPLQKKVPD